MFILYVAGFYWHLRDKETSWVDRVKLCRYAWKYDDVTFPNKKQVLLDWLVYALSVRLRYLNFQLSIRSFISCGYHPSGTCNIILQ